GVGLERSGRRQTVPPGRSVERPRLFVSLFRPESAVRQVRDERVSMRVVYPGCAGGITQRTGSLTDARLFGGTAGRRRRLPHLPNPVLGRPRAIRGAVQKDQRRPAAWAR